MFSFFVKVGNCLRRDNCEPQAHGRKDGVEG